MPHVEADRPGVFIAEVLGTGIRKAENSKAVCVSFLFLLKEYWDNESRSMIPWGEYRQTIFGKSWIIKKDGTPNERAIENLCEVFGWDGDLKAFDDPDRSWPECSITIEEQSYEGKTSLVVQWINPRDGGGKSTFSNLEKQDIDKLGAAHGATFRAIAGNIARNKDDTPF